MIITTALIPGKRAPTLVTEGCVRRMRPGSVIVDTAAPFGGNCELTQVCESEREGDPICVTSCGVW